MELTQGETMTRNQLISKYKGKRVAFKDMPFEYQFALAWYMAVDGEAWILPEEYNPSDKYRDSNYFRYIKGVAEEFKKVLPIIVKEHGDKKFGMLRVPMKDFTKILWERHKEVDGGDDNMPEVEGNQKDFKTYHKWYMKSRGEECKNHTSNKYPSILADESWKEEMIQDGWHRFHVYVQRGVKKMPLVYFP
jgi:hypothetical protein